MTIEHAGGVHRGGEGPPNYYIGSGPVPPVDIPDGPRPGGHYYIGNGPVPPVTVHPVPVTADTDDHTPARVENQKPWVPQQNAAYARMAAQLITALHIYQQETADAGRLLEVPARLAAEVRAELETAAWHAWAAEMNRAFAWSRSVISAELADRERSLTPSYARMLEAVATAWQEWHRWMDLAATTSEGILGPAQQAYDHRMEQAYTTMMAASADAENSWRRMYDGAERAGTLLTSFGARAGTPPPA